MIILLIVGLIAIIVAVTLLVLVYRYYRILQEHNEFLTNLKYMASIRRSFRLFFYLECIKYFILKKTNYSI